MQLSLSTSIVALAAVVGTVVGETHTVRLSNMCGLGAYPVLEDRDGNNLASGNGAQYVSNSSLIDATVYFQISNGRKCGTNECTTLHTTLSNENGAQTTFDLPTIKGSVEYRPVSYSIRDCYLPTVSELLPWDIEIVSVSPCSYFNGCDNIGATCANPECPAKDAEIVCRAQDVGLLVTFCP